MDEVSLLYRARDRSTGTHIALSWKGRVRFTVPIEIAGQRQCWKLFKPGRLEIPMRAMATLPSLLGAESCLESENLLLIREAIGKEAGLSSCRAGAPGPWYKDTVLLLDKAAQPLYIVKVGAGEAVNDLLTNEANWLRTLRDTPALARHIPELVAHRSAADLCFVAERPLSGEHDFAFNQLHVEFLRSLQEHASQRMSLEESRFLRNLRSRLNKLSGQLSEAWSTRLELGLRKIETSFSGPPILMVAAHNDFTSWNIRLGQNVAKVFDWEYADYEQFPLIDPLHFALAPMALKGKPTGTMLHKMRETVQNCKQWLGKERCYKAETQALAYLINLCTLYLWADRGKRNSHPTLMSYARVIDSQLGAREA